MSGRGVLRIIEGGELAWWCPGCKNAHAVPVEGPKKWDFNGNYDRPTFSPSANIEYHPYGHISIEVESSQRPGTVERCHCFVRDGQIEFLSDCTHALSGKTVRMEPF